MDGQTLTSLLSQQVAIDAASRSIVPQTLKSGSLLHALVTEITALGTEEKTKLILKLKAELASLAQTPIDNKNQVQRGTQHVPGLQPGLPNSTLIQSIESRIQLLQSAVIHLLGLKIGNQRVYALSDQKPQPGDKLLVRVRSDGQLNLEARPKTDSNLRHSEPGNSASIQNALKHDLPLSTRNNRSQQSLSTLLTALNTQATRVFATQHATSPTSKVPVSDIRNQILPQPVFKNIEALVKNILAPKPQQPASELANTVKQAIKNSGSFYEGNLGNRIKTLDPVTKKTTHTARISMENIPTDKSPTTTSGVDTKALLLNLVALLKSDPPVTHNVPRISQSVLSEALIAIFKTLGIKPKASNPTPQGHTQLHAQLRAEVAKAANISLARIQAQQLKSLVRGTHEVATTFTPTVELSLRVNDNIYPVLLYFQEKLLKEQRRNEEEEEKKKRKSKTARQWKVFMEFDLDDCGWFASEVSLLEERLSTHFWAQKPNTQTQLHSRLNQLKKKMEDSGLDVKEIMLLQGTPPEKTEKLQQHLVDIKT